MCEGKDDEILNLKALEALLNEDEDSSEDNDEPFMLSLPTLDRHRDNSPLPTTDHSVNSPSTSTSTDEKNVASPSSVSSPAGLPLSTDSGNFWSPSPPPTLISPPVLTSSACSSRSVASLAALPAVSELPSCFSIPRTTSITTSIMVADAITEEEALPVHHQRAQSFSSPRATTRLRPRRRYTFPRRRVSWPEGALNVGQGQYSEGGEEGTK